jgi:hypothetical protein
MGSQQWGMPVPLYLDMYHKFNARYEAFAGPLNARFLGMKGAKFGSLFLDTDKVFGSIGSFFDIDIPKLAKADNGMAWVVNPPYIEKILELTIIKIEDALENTPSSVDLTFFGVMPNWSDGTSYKMVEKSKFLKYMEVLHPGEHYYTDVQGRKIEARFGSMVYVLSNVNQKKEQKDYQSAFNNFFLK